MKNYNPTFSKSSELLKIPQKKKILTHILRVALISAVAILVDYVHAHAQFTSGRLVVLQVGDGTAALSNSSTALFLKEFTTAGVAGTSITIPTSGGTALTASGSATSEGGISLSGDGAYITIPGYNAATGVSNIASSSSTTNPRGVGKVDYNGNYTLPFTTTGFNTNNIRGATGNGTNYWATGANDGVRYLGSGTAAVVSSTVTNIRFLYNYNGNMYFTTGSGTTRGVYQVGSGLPTTGPTTATNIITVATGSSSSPFGFAVNPTGTIAYVASDDANGIQRYNYSGTWTLAYQVNSTSARGICVDWSGANPVIYATNSAATKIIKITDTGAGSSSSDVATAPTNTAFRGICWAPQAPAGTPVKLAVTTINGGVSPSKNTGFTVVVQAQDASNNPANVSSNTSFTFSVATGTGSIAGGTTTGTINSGFSQATISGVSYSLAQSGVSIKATRTSGDVLSDGTSALFTILEDASQIAFVSFPAANFTSNIIQTFTVEARRPDNTVDVNYTGNITLSLNSGAGTILGTLIKTCISGVATFNDIYFTAPGSKTVLATSGSLSQISSSISINTASLTEVILPQYIQGLNGTNNNRIPFAYRVTLSGLAPGTTYRYINQVVTSADGPGANGAGNIIFRDPFFFYRTTSASLANANEYGTFTTDGTGSYTGWFITEPTGNARFTPGNDLYMRIILNDGSGGSTPFLRLTTTNTVKVINFGTTISDGSGLRGNSSAEPRNFVFMYDNTSGSGRPIAGTFVELDGSDNIATPYVPFYSNFVNDVDGAYGVIIPNNLPNGIRRIEQRDLSTGALAGCPAIDADGVWPSSVNTVNPNTGTTPKVITSGDAPLDPTSSVPAISSISSNSPICNDHNLNLSVTASGSPTPSYVWSGSGTFSPNNAVYNPSVSGASTGSYTVTVTNQCGTTSSNVSVTVNLISTAPSSISGTTTICAGGSTTLTQVGGVLGTGADYEWFSGSCGGTPAGTGASIIVSPSITTTYHVRANGTCNITGCASVTVTVNPAPTASAVATGSTDLCLGGSGNVQLSFTGTGPWSGTLSGSGGPYAFGPTNTNPENIGVTPSAAGTQNYTVTAISDANCPTGTPSGTATFLVSSAPPSGTVQSITTPAGACQGDVFAVTVNVVGGQNIKYRYNTTSGSSQVKWSNLIGGPFNSYPTGFESTQTTVYAQAQALATGSTGYDICIQAFNGCAPPSNNKCKMVRGTVSTPSGITGSLNQCIGNTSQPYSVSGTPPTGVQTYVWSTTIAGAVITPVDPPLNSSVTVNFPTSATGTLSVQAALLCLGSSVSLPRTINISDTPAQPGNITGAAKACPGTTEQYSVPYVAGLTYNWTAPVNAFVASTSGPGNSIANITFNAGYNSTGANSNVQVYASNSCPINSTVKTKSVLSIVPATPGNITGTRFTGTCNSVLTYTVASPIADYYDWSVTGNASVSSGQGNQTVNISFQNTFTTGVISVKAKMNSCPVYSTSRTANATGAPAQPGPISVDFPPCAGGPGAFSITAVDGATGYQWTFTPNNGTVIDNNFGNLIYVTWGTGSSTINVKASNVCGTSQAKTLLYTPGCRLSGEEEVEAQPASMQVSPNPAHESAYVDFVSQSEGVYTVRISDVVGKTVGELQGTAAAGANRLELNLRQLPKGMYLVELSRQGTRQTQKLIVE